MSWFRHAIHRIAHYANPVTAVKAQVHQVERVAHFTQRSVQQQVRALEGAGHFVERQARKDYIKFNRVTSFIAPVVTPILAFIGELVPVFGLVLGPLLSFMGAVIARVSTSVALRSKGITGHHNSQMSRGKQNRTLKYGLYGSAAGGLVSVGSSLVTAGSATEAGAEIGASSPPMVPTISAAGEPSAQTIALTGAGQDVIPTVSSAAAPATVAAGGESGGILGTGITWGQVGGVVSPVISLVPTVLKALGIGQPAAAPAPGSQPGLGGSGGGGTEGTGDTSGGPLGAFAEDLAGLPLPIKLAAGALGLGVVVMAFSHGRKAA